MKHTIIIFIALFFSKSIYSQVEATFSCIDGDGWCGTYFKIYPDSSFIHTAGCEHMQSIQVGKMKHSSDTLFLSMYDLTKENFLDSVVFVIGDGQTDTIDVFCFDNFGNHVRMDDDFITDGLNAESWRNDPSQRRIDFQSSEIHLFNRSFMHFEQTNEFLPREDPYFYVDRSYVIKTDDQISFILKDVNNWTGLVETIPIPPNTRFINVYYHLPREIISILNVYSVKLDHEDQVVNK